MPFDYENGITFLNFWLISLPNYSRMPEKLSISLPMKALFPFIVMFLSSSVFAAEPLLLRHTMASIETTVEGSTATYRLELVNISAHNLHSLDLSLQDVGLSLTRQPENVHFQALPSGQQKHRLLVLHSALTAEQLSASTLLFHASSIDELGRLNTVLLRSVVMP